MQQSSHASIPIETFSDGNMNIEGSLSASSSASSSSLSKNDRSADAPSRSSSPSTRLNSQLRRPRRATSQRVDYDLKKRKIIPSDDYSLKTKRERADKSLQEDPNGANPKEEDELLDEEKELVELDGSGNAIQMNEPTRILDAKNGATGLPLSQVPSDKVKKEYLWNFKKGSSLSSNPNSDSDKSKPNKILEDSLLEKKMYKSNLNTKRSDSLTKLSNLREKVKADDIHAHDRDKFIDDEDTKEHEQHIHGQNTTGHIKIKATVSKDSKNKLFGQNSIANLTAGNSRKNNSSRLTTPIEEIENDDFCSACSQTGSFLCCDTCPRSFHFLCLNPPLSPDNLPEGDWSCPHCTFKLKYSNLTQMKKVEKEFIQTSLSPSCKLFGKLIFQLEGTNPKQFSLPNFVKDAFANVKTGSRDQYTDETEKELISEKQLFGAPYGQSVTKLDSYNPDTHYDPETGELLLCYKCGKSKMGTWDRPGDSRLIMRCDYCHTPWHLDCVPDVPRSSLKNLGTNWKCPLHASTDTVRPKQRRLTKHQKFIEPLQTSGFKNNGDVDIVLDEISAPGSKTMIDSAKNIGEFSPISILKENSVKLDFMDKIYRAKRVQRENESICLEHLIDKLVASSSSLQENNKKSDLEELVSFLYFALNKTPNMQKLWNFKELCNVAEGELEKEAITSEELKQLIMIKKLLESKPKEDIMRFLDLR